MGYHEDGRDGRLDPGNALSQAQYKPGPYEQLSTLSGVSYQLENMRRAVECFPRIEAEIEKLIESIFVEWMEARRQLKREQK